MLVPGPHIDKRISAVAAEEAYAPLLAGGVRVWIYQRSMMHVKAVLADGVMALVGSVNVNRRSMAKDEEVAVAIADREVTSELERHFGEDRELSEPATSAEKRHPMRKVAGKLIKPLKNEM